MQKTLFALMTLMFVLAFGAGVYAAGVDSPLPPPTEPPATVELQSPEPEPAAVVCRWPSYCCRWLPSPAPRICTGCCS